MIDLKNGRYWDLPWTLVSSCSRISPGCKNCWSLAMEKRFHKGIEGQIQVHPERLEIPLKRKKPTVWAVWNDLFHESVLEDFSGEAMIVMYECPQHTFLILTKRAENMERIINGPSMQMGKWPDNIWFIVTICNQDEANRKIPDLLRIPGNKGLSIEPMLGAIDLTELPVPNTDGRFSFNALTDHDDDHFYNVHNKIDLVILGGESGAGARPMYPDWVRSVRDQCGCSGVPFFFKQRGEWAELAPFLAEHQDFKDGRTQTHYFPPEGKRLPLGMLRVGKNKSGRLLDGREHNELPWISL
jgi:protein gp37